MRKLGIPLGVAFLLVSTVDAQQSPGRARRRSLGTESASSGVRASAILEPTYTPKDLSELTEKSPLILRGTVTMALPTRCRTPEINSCLSLETDFEVTVKRILKFEEPAMGPLGLKFDKVLVSEFGGKIGGNEVVIEGDLPFEVGEEYVLFLDYDIRPDLLRYEGYRWQVVGIWDGKFQIKDDRIKVAKNSIFNRTVNEKPNRADLIFEDMDATFLISKIEEYTEK